MVTVYSVPTSRHLTDQNGPPFGRDRGGVEAFYPKTRTQPLPESQTPRIHTEK